VKLFATLGRVVMTAVVAAGVVAGTAGMAQASDHRVFTSDFWGNTGSYTVYQAWSGEHRQVDVCDLRANGVSATIEFYYRLPGHFDDIYGSVSDANGSEAGCGSWWAPSGANIRMFRGYTGSQNTGWLYT
jgi:hypothetical protein